MNAEKHDMETTAEQLIRDKAYSALSQEELSVVRELCDSEEEFQNMQQFFREMDQLSRAHRTVVNPAIKESLDNIFAAKHPGIRANWSAPAATTTPQVKVVPLYQRKWFRIAAVFLLAAGTLPFWLMLAEKESVSKAPSLQMAKNEQQSKQTPEATTKGKAPVGFKKEVAAQITPDMVQAQTPVANDTDAAPAGTNGAVTYTWQAAPEMADENSQFAVAPSKSLITAFSAPYKATTDKQSFGTMNGVNGFTSSATTPGTSFGLFADLNPDGKERFQLRYFSNGSPLTASLADQPADLLDLLEPAF